MHFYVVDVMLVGHVHVVDTIVQAPHQQLNLDTPPRLPYMSHPSSHSQQLCIPITKPNMNNSSNELQ